jgi:hypothetical protein
MRAIQVSTDVFQAIWAARKSGEEDEDAILRRLLKIRAAGRSARENGERGGFTDARYGVFFSEGFEIFRTYLGKEFRARVEDGRWVINGQPLKASTINQLSAAIGTSTENGWVNWEYRTPSGEAKKITSLRDPGTIRRRNR